MNNRYRQVWKDLLESSGHEEPIVSQDDLEDVVSLLIDTKVDPNKFVGNLSALISGGTGILSYRDLFFSEQSSQLSRTKSMTDEFIFGRPTGTPLWMLAAFPDVINWLNDKMIGFHKTSDNQDDEMSNVLSLWGIEVCSTASLDEGAFKNGEGYISAHCYQGLIENYVKDTGNAFETSIEHSSSELDGLSGEQTRACAHQKSVMSRIIEILFGK